MSINAREIKHVGRGDKPTGDYLVVRQDFANFVGLAAESL